MNTTNSPFEPLNLLAARTLKVAKPRTYRSVGSVEERIYQEAWDSLEHWTLLLHDYRVRKDSRFFRGGGYRLKELAKAITRQWRQRLIFERQECLQAEDESVRFLVECLQHACLGRKSQELGKLLKAAYGADLELTDEKVLDLRILLAQLEENRKSPSNSSPSSPLSNDESTSYLDIED